MPQHPCHRDIQPENILIDKEGHVRLCDFGCAHLFTEDAILPALPDDFGCLMYKSPELLSKSKDVTHGFGVDWWALGCVLVEMTIGEENILIFAYFCCQFVHVIDIVFCVVGKVPFGHTATMSKVEVVFNIAENSVSLPWSMSSTLKSLIKGLLIKKDELRFTFDEVVASAWMKDEASWSKEVS